MDKIIDTNWLTMKQVCERTKLQASTVSRYKDIFPEYITYRYTTSTMLEFDERCIPILQKIYEIYRDRSSGRRTTEKVKELLALYYQEKQPIIELEGLITTTPQFKHDLPQDFITLVQKHIQLQESRLELIEEQNRAILEQQALLLHQQGSIHKIVNDNSNLLAELAREHLAQKKKNMWNRLFGNKA